jgi:hypothetical protein
MKMNLDDSSKEKEHKNVFHELKQILFRKVIQKDTIIV